MTESIRIGTYLSIRNVGLTGPNPITAADQTVLDSTIIMEKITFAKN